MERRLFICFLLILLFYFPATQLAAETRILFLGDSITAGFGVDKEKAYPALVDAALKQKGFRDIQIINAGISGSTTASALSRLKWYSRIQPQILVLALGGNDGLRGISVESMEMNLDRSIQFALEKGMKIILAGMQIPPNYGVNYATAFREVFSKLAARYPITFMPFLLKDVGGNPELNLPDGIHPTAEGHRLITANMMPYILEIL
ncbi:MAG: arylesterase [SAR324 cluster bacterium]|nr:arylesterase [SAR324 cluster bacterium]